MSINIDKKLKNSRETGYIQKSFVEYRDRLLNYARSYYKNQINDFSETSLGGMFLDFAALVGDSMTFYIDQQLNELDYEKATNIQNINRHLRRAGIKSSPPSPAVANVTFSIVVQGVNDLSKNPSNYPDPTRLPVIKKGTSLNSIDNIPFVLAEDVDFGDMEFVQKELNVTDEGIVLDYILTKKGLCVSGEVEEETVFLDGDSSRFLSYDLQNVNVTFIEKVMDSDLNEYYEVEYLSQDTIYKKVENSKDTYFEVVPAPYRFVKEENFSSGVTTLRFGNGDGKELKDDVLVNPQDISLPLLGRNYSSRFSLDPQKLLSSLSLGVSPAGKALIIKYMHGGGNNHNVSAGAISQVVNSIFTFPGIANETEENNQIQLQIIQSLSVVNQERAIGGTNGLSIEELRLQIPNALKMQSRVITHKDLLSRLYTMPSNFGRIHKAAVIDNPFTKLTKDLHVVCKDKDGYYVQASDTLKINIQKYLNEFRLIGDTFNIIDSSVVNFGITLKVKVREGFDPSEVVSEVKLRIVENMRFDTLQIGEAININNIIRICSNTQGVLSVVTPIEKIISIKTSQNNRIEDGNLLSYHDNLLSIVDNIDSGLLFPPSGGIFELKYSNQDIKVGGV